MTHNQYNVSRIAGHGYLDHSCSLDMNGMTLRKGMREIQNEWNELTEWNEWTEWNDGIM